LSKLDAWLLVLGAKTFPEGIAGSGLFLPVPSLLARNLTQPAQKKH